MVECEHLNVVNTEIQKTKIKHYTKTHNMNFIKDVLFPRLLVLKYKNCRTEIQNQNTVSIRLQIILIFNDNEVIFET